MIARLSALRGSRDVELAPVADGPLLQESGLLIRKYNIAHYLLGGAIENLSV